jgi:uncharacterized protein
VRGEAKSLLLGVTGLFLLAGQVLAQVAVPPLHGRVNDLAGVIAAEKQAALEQQLAAIEARKGAQVVILTVATTQPETIEQFSMRVAESWKLGRKGVDDGVLILLASQDRKARIEVGYGLEGVLPDAVGKRIIEEAMIPEFRRGDYGAGLLAGTSSIARLLEGEALPEPRSEPQAANGADFPDSLPLVVIVAGAIGQVLRALAGRFAGALVAGIGAGIVTWILLLSLAWALGAGIVAFLLALLAGTGRGGGGRWSSGGGGGWSGGGGGGFSGGGGSFGGGGASGRW